MMRRPRPERLLAGYHVIMFPTVREVMGLDPFRIGAPRLVAGESGLDRPVRWVHSAEVPDIASLLRGGELVLLTGIGLPADEEGIRAFVNGLAEVGWPAWWWSWGGVTPQAFRG